MRPCPHEWSPVRPVRRPINARSLSPVLPGACSHRTGPRPACGRGVSLGGMTVNVYSALTGFNEKSGYAARSCRARSRGVWVTPWLTAGESVAWQCRSGGRVGADVRGRVRSRRAHPGPARRRAATASAQLRGTRRASAVSTQFVEQRSLEYQFCGSILRRWAYRLYRLVKMGTQSEGFFTPGRGACGRAEPGRHSAVAWTEVGFARARYS